MEWNHFREGETLKQELEAYEDLLDDLQAKRDRVSEMADRNLEAVEFTTKEQREGDRE